MGASPMRQQQPNLRRSERRWSSAVATGKLEQHTRRTSSRSALVAAVAELGSISSTRMGDKRSVRVLVIAAFVFVTGCCTPVRSPLVATPVQASSASAGAARSNAVMVGDRLTVYFGTTSVASRSTGRRSACARAQSSAMALPYRSRPVDFGGGWARYGSASRAPRRSG